MRSHKAISNCGTAHTCAAKASYRYISVLILEELAGSGSEEGVELSVGAPVKVHPATQPTMSTRDKATAMMVLGLLVMKVICSRYLSVVTVRRNVNRVLNCFLIAFSPIYFL